MSGLDDEIYEVKIYDISINNIIFCISLTKFNNDKPLNVHNMKN